MKVSNIGNFANVENILGKSIESIYPPWWKAGFYSLPLAEGMPSTKNLKQELCTFSLLWNFPRKAGSQAKVMSQSIPCLQVWPWDYFFTVEY